ncbi:MAG: phage tail tube protein [Candidatus Thorarchaeota archaeon]
MSRVLTNNVALAYTIESSVGVAGTQWKLIEPNTINSFGPELSTVSRNPISKDRQRKKGTITDLDSAAEFDADLTMDHFLDFSEGFVFANYNGPIKFGPQETDTVTAVTGADSFTVDANGDLAEFTLVHAKGFTNAANNGLHVVDTGSAGTNLVVTTTLTAEASPPLEATVETTGYRTEAGDLDVTESAGVVTLTTTLLDFTTLDLTVGQAIWVGGDLAINGFLTAENAGFGRIVSIATNALVIDKTNGSWATEVNAAQLVDLYFGKFLRNVTVDDADFLERSFQFEGTYTDLESVGVDAYEYSKGNYCNEWSIELPLTEKATCTFGFVGTDTEPATTVRKTGADTPLEPKQVVAFNTTSDISRLRITEVDETGLTTYFKNVTLTINNNVSPEKVIGLLGAAFMNTGNLEIDFESTVLFTNKEVTAAIRANTTVTLDFSLRNDDGGLFFDIPACTIGGGDKEFPENESVTINTPIMAFKDPTLGTSIGISLFGYLPAV